MQSLSAYHDTISTSRLDANKWNLSSSRSPNFTLIGTGGPRLVISCYSSGVPMWRPRPPIKRRPVKVHSIHQLMWGRPQPASCKNSLGSGDEVRGSGSLVSSRLSALMRGHYHSS